MHLLLFLLVIIHDGFGQCPYAGKGNVQPIHTKTTTAPSPTKCDPNAKYRSFDGTCNNLKHPQFGSAMAVIQHVLPPAYDDGVTLPRNKSVCGEPLPSTRLVSNIVHRDRGKADDSRLNLLKMAFGQLLSHDITSVALPTTNGLPYDCGACDSKATVSPFCSPIPVPFGDDEFPSTPKKPACLHFLSGSSSANNSGLGYRTQLNTSSKLLKGGANLFEEDMVAARKTAFIDGSAFYGSDTTTANSLRTYKQGQIELRKNGNSPKTYLLTEAADQRQCQSAPDYPCFFGGDGRISQHPMLSSLHNMFSIEHNRIALELAKLNPKWNDETLYQEARRIVGAILAHISFAEYLPYVIGDKLIESYDLSPRKNGYYNAYDAKVDATLNQPFMTSAMRFGHTTVKRFYPRVFENNRTQFMRTDLEENFGSAKDVDLYGISSLLLGSTMIPAGKFGQQIDTVVRDFNFNKMPHPPFGRDVPAANIQRGRDQGVQSYNTIREHYGLLKLRSFHDKCETISPESLATLEKVYKSVDDIDLFTGLTSETPVHGGMVGMTAAKILGEQFQRIKRGDRFFYENGGQFAFTKGQLDEIRKQKIASVLCRVLENTKELQPNAFEIPDRNRNDLKSCKELGKLDLSLWKEKPSKDKSSEENRSKSTKSQERSGSRAGKRNH